MTQWIERNTCSGTESSDKVLSHRWPLLLPPPPPAHMQILNYPFILSFIKFSIHKGMRSSEQGEERRPRGKQEIV